MLSPPPVAMLLALLLLGSAAAGCGGQTTGDLSETAPGTGQGGSKPQAADAGKDADAAVAPLEAGADGGKKPKPPVSHDGGGGGPSDAGADVHDAFAEFVDPGCPDAGPAETDFQCDPNAGPKACGAGLACYPFVIYPSDPCGQEIYGAQCVQPGTGGQGEPCDGGCIADHICVITGQGTQCVQMCDTASANPCSDGLVCADVDIPGIGGCI
jgi:hypothetical protein